MAAPDPSDPSIAAESSLRSSTAKYSRFLSERGVSALDEMLSPRYRSLLTSIVIAGALLRALAVLFLGDTNPATAQIWETGGLAIMSLKYGILTGCISDPDHIASCLMGSRGSEAFTFPSAFVPPLPIFLFMAAFKLLGVSKTALAVMLWINVIGGAAVVYYCGRIAETLFQSRAIALVAAFTAAIHPVLVYSVATYHGVNIYLPLILCIFDLSSSRYSWTALRAFSIGLLLGITILIRTEYLFLGMAIVGGALLRHRRIALAALCILTACCVVSPWTIRNYIVFHRFMPVVSTPGYALFKGFNPLANGSGHWVDTHFVATQLIGRELALVPRTPLYEIARDDVFRKAADEYIAQHPAQSFLVLPVRKVALFWLFDVYDPTTHQILYQLAFWPLFFTSLVGLGIAYKKGLFSRSDHRIVLIYFLAQTAVIVGYAVHARYRLNVEPFLAGYSALAVVAFASRWLQRPAAEPSV
jgi:hypothetical protein